jgi:hypothetical protein
MPPLLKRLRTRASERLDRAAIGTQQPAGSEPAELPDGKPSARERGKMRRRLRQLAKLRRALLLDLGALTFEMHRQQRHDPALIERRAKEAIAVDAEARGLAHALDEDLPVEDVLAAGIARTCAGCGAIQAADARYCSACGTAVGEQPEASSSQPSNDDVGRVTPPWAKELG